MKRSLGTALAVMAALTLQAVSFARAQSVPPSLRACTAETDDARRLACFDREMARMSESKQTDQPPAVAAAPAQPPLSAEEQFGRSGAMVREERDRRHAESTELKELKATVTKVTTRALGELVITLDNGQIWLQQTADAHFDVSVQDRITIKPAALGSYLMVAPSRRSTRVTRLH
jgi:hypothetical protein